MSAEEFFTSLLGRDTSREFADLLVDMYRLRTRDYRRRRRTQAG
jgi:hypothetical protein